MPAEQLEQYTKDGFVIVKNLIPIKRVNAVLESVFKMYNKYSEKNDDFKSMEEPWNT